MLRVSEVKRHVPPGNRTMIGRDPLLKFKQAVAYRTVMAIGYLRVKPRAGTLQGSGRAVYPWPFRNMLAHALREPYPDSKWSGCRSLSSPPTTWSAC